MPGDRPAESALPSKAFLREEHLRKSAQFKHVYERGKKIITPVVIFFVCTNALRCSRLGLTVSKKNGNAVQRNRIKRLLRESFRLQKNVLHGVDVVAIPRRGAVNRHLQDYELSFQILARKLGMGDMRKS